MPYVRLLAPTRRVHLRALQGVRQVRLFLHRGFLDGWLLLLPWLRLVCLGAGLRRSLRSIIAITLMWASERAWTGAGEWAGATSPVAAAASAAAAPFSPRRRKNAPPLFLVIFLHAWRSGRGGGGSAVAAASTPWSRGSPIFSEGWQGRGRLCRRRRCNPTTIHTSV